MVPPRYHKEPSISIRQAISWSYGTIGAMNTLHYIFAGIAGILLVVSAYLGYSLYTLEERYENLSGDKLAVNKELDDVRATTTARIGELEMLLNETRMLLEKAVDENEELSDDLDDEKDRNQEFEDQIDKIGTTVGRLDKLSKTDEELLQKYSKVYFLNEHYVPEKLKEIEKTYQYNETLTKYVHGSVWPYLEDMLAAALDDGVKIWIVSAYRSFDEQGGLKGAYTTTYGSGANTFSADQGYSEHQLGTTLDFTTEGLGGGLSGFGNTAAYTWLTENAHKYGFVLSYPENNGYYIYEPWHWRFVGEDLAEDLHDADAHFYDWDQRKIDEYLISIFD